MKTNTTLFGNRSVATLRTMSYGIYLRKSTDREDTQLLSLPDQKKQIEKHIASRGLDIVRVYEERVSARIAHKRPAFKSMVADIRSGKIQGIICWKANRLARNNEEGGLITDLLSNGVIRHIITVADGEFFPYTPQMMLSFHFANSSQFSKDLSVDTKRGLQTKVDMGYQPRPAIIGYVNDPSGRKGEKVIRVDTINATKLKRVMMMTIRNKWSIREAYKHARELGLTHRGKPVSFTTLYKALKNPFYYGEFRWHGTVIQGKHPALITKNQFLQLQQHICLPKREKYTCLDFPYRGMLECGECGASITASRHIKRNRTYIYYRCTKKVDPNCTQKAITASDLSLQLKSLSKRGIIPSMENGCRAYRLTNRRVCAISQPFHLRSRAKQVLNHITSLVSSKRGVNEL